MTAEAWRVGLASGEAREVRVEVRGLRLCALVPSGPYHAWGDEPAAAVTSLAGIHGWPVREILAPGEPTRAELTAQRDAAQADARACAEERDDAYAREWGMRFGAKVREIEERARREGEEALTEARRVLHFARVAAEAWEAASLRGDGPSMDRLDAAMRDLVDEAGDWSLSGPLTTTDALAAARDDARVERDAMRTQRDAAWAQGAEAMRAAARVAVWRALESRDARGPVPHILADAAIRALPLPEVSRG